MHFDQCFLAAQNKIFNLQLKTDLPEIDGQEDNQNLFFKFRQATLNFLFNLKRDFLFEYQNIFSCEHIFLLFFSE
jgi:hypothetical protein